MSDDLDFYDVLEEYEAEFEEYEAAKAADELVDEYKGVETGEPLAVWDEDVVEVDFQRIYWERAYPKQERFVLSEAPRYQLFLGGRGCGKTWALMLKALWLAILNPGLEGAIFGRTLTKDIAKKLFKLFMEHLATFKRVTGVDLLQDHNTGSWTTTLRNGAVIHWLSYGRIDQLENNRGFDLAWAVLDESDNSQIDPGYAMDVIDDAVRTPQARVQQLAIATTPNGLRGVVGRFVKAQGREDDDYFVVHATSYDNPHVDHGQIHKREKGRSKRQAQQELHGIVLRPSNVVMREFSKTKHVVPYTVKEGWIWGVGVDWGTTKGHIVGVQVSPYGVWTVFAEDRVDDVQRPQFRQRVDKFVATWMKKIGSAPWMMGADRAVKSENTWLRGRFGRLLSKPVGVCESTEEQKVLRGVGYLQYMLDPADGSDIRLYFSDALTGNLDAEESGIIGAMMQYRYREIVVDGIAQVTNSPLKDRINDDPIDSLRYLVTVSRNVPEMHGGAPLPCIRADSYRLAA